MTKARADRVANELRRRVRGAKAGDRLPSVRELMASFRVSQLTVQKALDALKEEGLITTSVGRGTFAGADLHAALEPRNVLVLTREQQTDRSDEVARSLHRALLKRNWRAAVLTFSDFAQPADLVKNAPGFDACVIHPRLETLPLGLLAALRARSRAVVVEGYSVAGVDLDTVAVDWRAAVGMALRHLTDLGHRRIGLVMTDRPARAFRAVKDEFRILHSWANLDASVDPVVVVPEAGEPEIYANVAVRLSECADQRGRPAFSAIVMYLGAYHGELLFEAVQSVAPAMSIAMLGFTDLAVEHAEHLTTIGQSTANVTEEVAAAIERRLADPAAPYATHYIPPELMARSSTLKRRDVA